MKTEGVFRVIAFAVLILSCQSDFRKEVLAEEEKESTLKIEIRQTIRVQSYEDDTYYIGTFLWVRCNGMEDCDEDTIENSLHRHDVPSKSVGEIKTEDIAKMQKLGVRLMTILSTFKPWNKKGDDNEKIKKD